jgi:CheY-like chemotaxis protein
VLIIDDEPLLATSLKRLLAKDHDVEVITSSKNALTRLQEDCAFDMVLCDLMMPDLTGDELYAEVRAFAPQQAARFVFVTGGAFTRQAREFLERVPNPWLDKPVDARKLYVLLAALVGRRAPSGPFSIPPRSAA